MDAEQVKVDFTTGVVSWSSTDQSMQLHEIFKVTTGKATKSFDAASPADRCFSLHTPKRALDLECETADQCAFLVRNFTRLVPAQAASQ